jgi:hypothetical protein
VDDDIASAAGNVIDLLVEFLAWVFSKKENPVDPNQPKTRTRDLIRERAAERRRQRLERRAVQRQAGQRDLFAK